MNDQLSTPYLFPIESKRNRVPRMLAIMTAIVLAGYFANAAEPAKVDPAEEKYKATLKAVHDAGKAKYPDQKFPPPKPEAVEAWRDILLKTVHAKVFTRDGQTMAYIWPMQPWEMQFELTVPEGKAAQYYAAPKGERVDLASGKHRLTINKESWSRIVGLDMQTLRSGIEEVTDR